FISSVKIVIGHSSFESDRSQNNISERDIPMIPLKHERARLPLAALQSASGNTRNLLVVYHRLAVQNDRDITAKQRDVVGLPLSPQLAASRISTSIRSYPCRQTM